MLCKAFDSLFGVVALQIRKLVDKNPKSRKQIYKRSKKFAKNLDEVLKELIYGTDTHENGRGQDAAPQPIELNAKSLTGRTRTASECAFPNALRSAEASNIVLCQGMASEPTSAAAERHYFNDDIEATLDHQHPWMGNDSGASPSTYEQTLPLRSETSGRSDRGASPECFSVDPAFLSQRVADPSSPIRVLSEETSTGSRHVSEDIVVDFRRSKKRASDARIEPRAKRSRRMPARNSRAVPILQKTSRQDQITMPTQYAAIFPETRLISQTSNLSFQVGQVPAIFQDKLGKQQQNLVPLLTDLFFAIASPTAFRQLAGFMKGIEALKSPEQLQVSKLCLSIADVVNRLEALECITAASSLLRRFYLLRLYQQKSSLMESMAAERLVQRSGSSKDDQSGRIASLVIDKMTQQAYPSCGGCSGDQEDLFQIKRRSLQNKLHCATNWHTLQEEYPLGIIALVPVGKEFRLQNQK